MKGKEINPTVAASVVIGIIVLGGAIFWFSTNSNPPKVDLSKQTKAQIEDWDPPKPGQPGYRERIDEAPK
jgi:hypothetical protein